MLSRSTNMPTPAVKALMLRVSMLARAEGMPPTISALIGH